MNFLKRGMTSVVRRPGKTVILLVLIFILGNIIAGALSVRQAVKNTEMNLRAEMNPVATVTLNNNRYMELANQNPEFVPESVSADAIEKIGALPYVKYFDYSASTALENSSLQRYSGNENNEGMSAGYSGSFLFSGVNNADMIGIKEEKMKLVSGRMFNEEEVKNLTYVAMVSQNFAAANSLAVGSVISFENKVYYIGTNQVVTDNDLSQYLVASQKYDFEIIGIFEPVKQVQAENGNDMTSVMLDDEAENTIYTTNRVINEAALYNRNEYAKYDPEIEKYSSDPYYTTIYVLNDPMDLETFGEEASAFLPDYYTIESNMAAYDKVAAPMKSMQGIASIILYTAVGATLVILSLLITLFLRDRRHEIGIYLSLGERKIKIAGQVLAEVAVIAVAAITLSLFSGNTLSGALSEKMLTDQIIAEQEQANNDFAYSYSYSELDRLGYQNTVTGEEVAESYGVSLDLLTILLFYAIGVGTVCVSTLVPILYTTRLNPKKILM